MRVRVDDPGIGAVCATIPRVTTTVQVELGPRSYAIHIAPGALDRTGQLIAPLVPAGGKVLVVSDATVARLHGERLLAALAAGGLDAVQVAFPAGESAKSLAQAEALWQACAQHHLDRNATVIGFGGGVSGDLAGFIAACWMRGIAFVQVPTTLLAMVDSSVGGKTGVNSAAGKNLVGAFHQPRAVVIDPELLRTMDDREYRAGLAEVLKYGVIHDPVFLAWQEANAGALAARAADAVAHAVAVSCRIKATYVQQDEFERGVRAHLNYGHTFGHALERETRYTAYLHGEAVGIGMRMAADLARRLGVLSEPGLGARQDDLLRRYGLPLAHRASAPDAVAAVLAGHCLNDKKALRNRPRFVLPVRPGEVVLREADHDRVEAAFRSAITAP